MSLIEERIGPSNKRWVSSSIFLQLQRLNNLSLRGILSYRSVKVRLKRIGPWRTPLVYWKGCVWLFPILIEQVEFEYEHLFVTACIRVHRARPNLKCRYIKSADTLKYSEPTPRLARVIIYLFIDFLFTEFTKWQTEFREGFGLFPLFFVYCFRIPLFWVYRALLGYMLSKVTHEGRDLGQSCVAFVGGAFRSMIMAPSQISWGFFPYSVFSQQVFFWPSYLQYSF